MNRKYFSEFGLGVYASYKTLIPVEELKHLEEYDKRKYHIYQILACPKIYFNMDKTCISNSGVNMSIFEYVNGIKKEYNAPTWEIDKNINYEKVELSSKFPHTSIHVEIKDSEFLNEHPEIINPAVDINANVVYNFICNEIKDKVDYEVLYIGQAYGKRGERTALDRLSSHSTLQEILIDAHSKYPDKHIYILLLEISSQLNMIFNGLHKNFVKTDKEDHDHVEAVLSDLPKEQQVINIAEAAMINYFKPPYNVNFVENFPDERHLGYKQYFDLDYNCLSVEIDLSFDNFPIVQLYSNANRINNYMTDIIMYNLYNDPNRANMYEIFKPINL